MNTIIIIIIHLIGAIVSYLLHRKYKTVLFNEWSVFDRIICLIVSITFGWISVIVALIMYGIISAVDKWGDQSSNW